MGHEYDSAGRRKNARREDGTRWDYTYNARSEVTGAVKKGSGSGGEFTVPGMNFGYRYDGIGNRTLSWSGEDAGEGIANSGETIALRVDVTRHHHEIGTDLPATGSGRTQW